MRPANNRARWYLQVLIAGGALLFSNFALATKTQLPSGSIIYGVVPPFFGKEPLKAVTAHMDQFHEQGIDALWLSPIYPTDVHGSISYAVTDYFGVREDFGTQEDLRNLIKAAHNRHIKVLLDIVPNHTSIAHPYFQDAEAKGPASPYYDYYQRDDQGKPVHYFNWENLPNLNYANPKVVRMMKDVFIHWVRDFQVDGFRIDAAWGVRLRAPNFWPELAAELDAIQPGTFLMGEASARDSYYCKNGFALAYDWTNQLGHWAWEDVFRNPAQFADRLGQAMASEGCSLTKVARFINNNDTGQRFITRYGPALTKLAAVLQHTVPGTPIVYTGDEVGAEYSPYDVFEPINWSDPLGFKPFYRRLATLRKSLPALSSGDFLPVSTPGRNDVFAFVRKSGADAVLVVLNFGTQKSVVVKMPMTQANERIAHLTEAVTDTKLTVSIKKDLWTLVVNPGDAAVLVLGAGKDGVRF